MVLGVQLGDKEKHEAEGIRSAERAGLRFSVRKLWKGPMWPQNMAVRNVTHLYPQVAGEQSTEKENDEEKL